MHKNTFDGRVLPGAAAELICSPDLLAATIVATSKGRDGKKGMGEGLLIRGGKKGGEGPTYKKKEEREGGLLLRMREGEGDGKGGEENSSQSQCE